MNPSGWKAKKTLQKEHALSLNSYPQVGMVAKRSIITTMSIAVILTNGLVQRYKFPAVGFNVIDLFKVSAYHVPFMFRTVSLSCSTMFHYRVPVCFIIMLIIVFIIDSNLYLETP